MQQITLKPIDDFSGLGRRWQALEADADGGFFRGWVFLGCLAEQRFAGAGLLCVQRNGVDVALGLIGRGQGRQWLNETGDRAADAVFIEHNGLLVRRGHEDVVGPALRHAVEQGGALVLSGIDAGTLRAAEGAGWLELQQSRFAPCVDLWGFGVSVDPGGSKPGFVDTLSANARAQIRRSMRLYGPALGVELPGSLEAAHGFFDELVALHQQSWERRGLPGAFAEGSILAFHRALINRGWPSGHVHVLRVVGGEGVIGMLYNFISSGRVLSYQSGFAYPQGDARAKPGLVCHVLAIGHYARRRQHYYDLLAGADRYKLTLSREGESLHWATLHAPWSAAGVVAKARSAAKVFRK